MLEPKLRMRASLVIGVLSVFLASAASAGGPSAGQLEQTTAATVFASDLFGPNSDTVTFDVDTSSRVLLETGNDISVGARGDITIALQNAAFASEVFLNSLTVSAGDIDVQSKTGGQVGDTSVTFSILIAGTGPILTGADFIFTPADLVGISTGSPLPTNTTVLANASVNPATATLDFPTSVVTPGDTSVDCTDVPADCQIVTAADPYLNFDTGDGNDTATVLLTDREVIQTGTGNQITDATVSPPDTIEALLLGEHDFDLVTPDPSRAVESDGSTPWGVGATGEGSGLITITAGGDFRPGDRVFIDLPTGTDGQLDPGEAFTINGNTATFANVPTATALTGNFDVFYVPNGVDDLSPTTFSLGAEITYTKATNVPRRTPVQGSTSGGTPAELSFFGIESQGYAYGVARPGAADRSFVRVRNETATDLAIFFDCTDDGGNSNFKDLGILGPGETEAFDSDELGEVLGTQGRAACDVFSNGDLTVQHKIRAAGVLVDGSVVVGRELCEGCPVTLPTP